MALVGPRLHVLAHDSYFWAQIVTYDNRFRVRPGLNGWAQINGSRGATQLLSDMQRWVDFDLWYVENHSFAVDYKILNAAALHLLPGRSGAY